MNIKKLIILSVVIESIFLFSCKKESGTDNTSAPPQLSLLLTQDTLRFESYILNWSQATEHIYYKRGDSNNSINYDTAWLKFDKSGTYKARISASYNYIANWQFLENGTKLRLWNKTRNFDQKLTIVKISNDTIEWLDSSTDSLFSRFIH